MKRIQTEPLFVALALLGLIYIGGMVVGLALPDSPDQEERIETREEAQEIALAIQPEFGIAFAEVSQQVGLDFTHSAFRWGFSGDPVAMMGGGLCWLDYDQNGWLDLYIVNSYALAEAGQWQTEEGGLPTSALFANENGTFADASVQSLTNLPLRGNGCVAADFNLDGWDDLYITTSRANLMLINQKDGTFQEVAQDAGSYAYGWQTGTSVGDINGDRLPDLFVSGYVDINNQIEGSTMGFPNTNYGLRDLLFIHQGLDESGLPIFAEIGETVGLEPFGIDDDSEYEYGLGSLMIDIDQDGDLDIFVANDTNPNRLYLNQPADNELGFMLVESGDIARVSDINSGMGVSHADFNSDGHLDIFVTNLGQQTHSVYWHDGRAGLPAYIDAAADLGVGEMGVGITGWGTIWEDFDNDGDLDLFTVNGHVPILGEDEKMPILFYTNGSAQGSAGQLALTSEQTGLAALGTMHGRGAAQADFDNDGDLDVAITQIGGQLLLLENRSDAGNSVTVEFNGSQPIGAELTAVLPNGQTIVRQVILGDSYLSSADPRIVLGLGNQPAIANLTIRYLDGTATEFDNIPAGEWVSVNG